MRILAVVNALSPLLDASPNFLPHRVLLKCIDVAVHRVAEFRYRADEVASRKLCAYYRRNGCAVSRLCGPLRDETRPVREM